MAASQAWLTAPVPASDQNWYRNAVIAVETDLPPKVLLALLLDIEQDFGRVRGAKNEARVLDLDLIGYNGQVLDEGDLTLPHPRLHERSFVLYPLREIAPGWMHPVLNLSVDIMIEKLPGDQTAEPLKTEVA